jgi:hypothetical protein
MAPRCRRHQAQCLQQTTRHAQRTNLQREGKLEGWRSPPVVNDMALRLGIGEEGFKLEAAQITRQRAPAQIGGLPVVHVMPPDERDNTPFETANCRCLTGLGKAVSGARITERKYRHLWHRIKGTPGRMPDALRGPRRGCVW